MLFYFLNQIPQHWWKMRKPGCVKRQSFGEDEEDLIIKLHALLGNRWSLIAGRLPGRTDNEVKKYWNSHIRRKLVSIGIDPDNHRLNQIIPTGNHRCHADCKKDGSKLSTTCVNDDEQLSDCASCFDDEKSTQLNLDLTISFPAIPPTVEEKQENADCNISKDIENDHTLQLFR